jgi:hypothetical protein
LLSTTYQLEGWQSPRCPSIALPWLICIISKLELLPNFSTISEREGKKWRPRIQVLHCLLGGAGHKIGHLYCTLEPGALSSSMISSDALFKFLLAAHLSHAVSSLMEHRRCTRFSIRAWTRELTAGIDRLKVDALYICRTACRFHAGASSEECCKEVGFL